jgi:hypothetical protein
VGLVQQRLRADAAQQQRGSAAASIEKSRRISEMPGYTLVAAASVGVIGTAICYTYIYPPQQPEPEPEPEPASAGPPEHYAVAIHPPPGPVCYGSGVEVYAQIKAGAGSQGWARAVVTGAVPPSDPTAPAAAAAAAAGTEHTVRVLGGCGPSFNRQRAGSEVVVRAARLIAVPTDTRLVIVAETDDYRRLSRAFATPADFVVDIGCSYGEGTKLIAAQCPQVLGLELVPEVVAAARKRHPHIRFEQLDCLAAPAGARRETPSCLTCQRANVPWPADYRKNLQEQHVTVAESAGRVCVRACVRVELAALCSGCNKVFIDINGTRCAKTKPALFD